MEHGVAPIPAAHHELSLLGDVICENTTSDIQNHSFAITKAAHKPLVAAFLARKISQGTRQDIILGSFATGKVAIESLAGWTIW
jgi:hypothetical protein